jgi:hypothetical protein
MSDREQVEEVLKRRAKGLAQRRTEKPGELRAELGRVREQLT